MYAKNADWLAGRRASQAQPVQLSVCLDAGRLPGPGRTGAQSTSEPGSAGTADSSVWANAGLARKSRRNFNYFPVISFD
jgi:hypothetical protein